MAGANRGCLPRATAEHHQNANPNDGSDDGCLGGADQITKPENGYGQAWTLMMTIPYARCAGDCKRICTGQRCANKYPTLTRAEIPTQHIFGVFNGRDAGPG